jgi:hypothetical protein
MDDTTVARCETCGLTNAQVPIIEIACDRWSGGPINTCSTCLLELLEEGSHYFIRVKRLRYPPADNAPDDLMTIPGLMTPTTPFIDHYLRGYL